MSCMHCGLEHNDECLIPDLKLRVDSLLHQLREENRRRSKGKELINEKVRGTIFLRDRIYYHFHRSISVTCEDLLNAIKVEITPRSLADVRKAVYTLLAKGYVENVNPKKKGRYVRTSKEYYLSQNKGLPQGQPLKQLD